MQLFFPPSHQFEDDILSICLKLLDTNPKFLRDQNRDCSRRNDPVYIGRVVSAMVSPTCRDTGGCGARWHQDACVRLHPSELLCCSRMSHRGDMSWRMALFLPRQPPHAHPSIHHSPCLWCHRSIVTTRTGGCWRGDGTTAMRTGRAPWPGSGAWIFSRGGRNLGVSRSSMASAGSSLPWRVLVRADMSRVPILVRQGHMCPPHLPLSPCAAAGGNRWG